MNELEMLLHYAEMRAEGSSMTADLARAYLAATKAVDEEEARHGYAYVNAPLDARIHFLLQDDSTQ